MKTLAISTFALFLLAGSFQIHAQSTTQRGDVNLDGEVGIGDVTCLIDYLLNGTWNDEPVTPIDDDGHEWVDLGLPSGTLWATCNVGATSPEDNGYYFLWGDTHPVPYDSIFTYYYDKTYKWYEYEFDSIDTYDYVLNILKYNSIDNKTELDPEDDAATVNWGSNWCMPTKTQIEELITECTWSIGDYSATAYGPNGASLYFPYASAYYGSWNSPVIGLYWSRSLCTPEELEQQEEYYGDAGMVAWTIRLKAIDVYDYKGNYLYTDYIHDLNPEDRSIARSVRAVRVSRN